MGLAHRDASEILHIRWVVHVLVLVQLGTILLLEYLAIATEQGISFVVILAVLSHLVDEEEREALDATMEEGALLAEVCLDGFPYLDASLVVGGYVADDFLQL